MTSKRTPPLSLRSWQALLPLGIVVMGWWTYGNSFKVPFIFDDPEAIVKNSQIHSLWPLAHFLAPGRFEGLFSRPVVSLTLALNYALGGLTVVGYHLTNLLIHVLAGVTLYGLLRRTLALPRLQPRVGIAGPGLALAVSLLWLVHPLHTESVTYILQRCESLMGLWYFVALYSVVRGATTPRPFWWYTAAVVSCALGMGCKAVMVTAPLMIGLYDRVFLSGGWGLAWRQRRGFYLGLAATWGWLAFLLLSAPRIAEPSRGFHLKGVTPVAYFLTQPGVFMHYLKLALWPHSLCLDYGWPLAHTARAIVVPVLLTVSVGLATAWAWRRRPVLSFLGLWVFVTLAPTSSLIPIRDPAVEHRMYLPLAGIVILAVIGGWELLRRIPMPAAARRPMTIGLVVVVVGMLGTLTFRRNEVYRSELSIWSDVVAKRPDNPRARSNLAVILMRLGRLDEAAAHCAEALRIQPDYAAAVNNMGTILAQQGKRREALGYYAKALELEAGFAEPYNNIGLEIFKEGRLDEAIARFTAALQLQPDYAEAHQNLGLALASQGKLDQAIAQYTEALRLQPDFAEAHNNLGLALASQGHLDDAVSQYREALRLQPDFAEAHNNLGLALANQSQFEEAITHYTVALRLQPDSAEGHNNLGIVLARQGKLDEAAHYFSRALELQEDYPDARHNLELIRKQQGQ